MLVIAALIPNQFQLKKGKIGYDGYKKIKGIKLGADVNDSSLPISILIALANTNYSKFYFSIIDRSEIKISNRKPKHNRMLSLLMLALIPKTYVYIIKIEE